MPVAARMTPADVDEEAAVDELGEGHGGGLRRAAQLARLALAPVEHDRRHRRLHRGGVGDVVEEDARRALAPSAVAFDGHGEDVAEDLHPARVVAVGHADDVLELARSEAPETPERMGALAFHGQAHEFDAAPAGAARAPREGEVFGPVGGGEAHDALVVAQAHAPTDGAARDRGAQRVPRLGGGPEARERAGHVAHADVAVGIVGAAGVVAAERRGVRLLHGVRGRRVGLGDPEHEGRNEEGRDRGRGRLHEHRPRASREVPGLHNARRVDRGYTGDPARRAGARLSCAARRRSRA